MMIAHRVDNKTMKPPENFSLGRSKTQIDFFSRPLFFGALFRLGKALNLSE